MNKQFEAVTSNSICPDLVSVSKYGQHRSKVVGDKRYWLFVSGSGRDLFLEDVQRDSAIFHRTKQGLRRL